MLVKVGANNLGLSAFLPYAYITMVIDNVDHILRVTKYYIPVIHVITGDDIQVALN